MKRRRVVSGRSHDCQLHIELAAGALLRPTSASFWGSSPPDWLRQKTMLRAFASPTRLARFSSSLSRSFERSREQFSHVFPAPSAAFDEPGFHQLSGARLNVEQTSCQLLPRIELRIWPNAMVSTQQQRQLACAHPTLGISRGVLSPSRFPSLDNAAVHEEGLLEVLPMEASSTLKKRRLKMNKHKYRKRRKRDRRRTKR